MDDRRLAQVRGWCAQARIDGDAGWPAELSDPAAVLIASARVDERTRAVLLARHRAGRGLPSIGGYTVLRRLADELARLDERTDRLQTGTVSSLIGYRATNMRRRLDALAATVEVSTTHYASGVRAIRRDRRSGVHLEPRQRAAVVRALLRTPAPLGASPVEQLRNAASGASGRLARLSNNPMLTQLSSLRSPLGRMSQYLTVPPSDERRFSDRYDTLLFLAGTLVDRIDGSPVWQSDHFAVQRLQLDLADELVQIAVDTVALQEIDTDLVAVAASAVNGPELADGRRASLGAVWDQLLERVAALARIADLLATAEERVRVLAAIDRTVSLDSRIDELIARSGDRELSAANTHFVGDQMAGPDVLLAELQSAMHADILMITSRHR